MRTLSPGIQLMVVLATMAGCSSADHHDPSDATPVTATATTTTTAAATTADTTADTPADIGSIHSDAGIRMAAAGPPPPGHTNPCLPQPVFGWDPPRAGDLDQAFGCRGVARHASVGYDIEFRAIAVQPDDRIVAAGRIFRQAVNNNDGLVLRFTSDGKLDSSFGTGGVVVSNLEAGGGESFEAVAIQPDGRIVVGGYLSPEDLTPPPQAVLRRLNADGSFDPGFTNGLVPQPAVLVGGMTRINGMALAPDGSIAAVGTTCSVGPAECQAALGRFAGESGVPLPGFGTDGVVLTRFGGHTVGRGYAVTTSATSVLFAGEAGGSGGGTDLGMARYAGLSPDAAFGTAGQRVIHRDPTEAVRGVAPYGDGYLLVGGATPAMGPEQFFLQRIAANGAPVAGFGPGNSGRVIDPLLGFGGVANAVTIDDASRVIAVGTAKTAGASRMAVTRYTFAGVADGGFGSGGRATLTTGGVEARANAVGRQSNGRIIAAGSARAAAGSSMHGVVVALRP